MRQVCEDCKDNRLWEIFLLSRLFTDVMIIGVDDHYNVDSFLGGFYRIFLSLLRYAEGLYIESSDLLIR